MFQVIPMQARTLVWWLDQENDIEFSPIYQRKSRIWSPKDKQFLIDSILNEFDIPKIYLADFTFMNTVLNRSNKKYAIIDGKQRLETIFEFFAGRIVLATDFELAEDPSQKLGGLSFQGLTRNFPKVARKFENYNLTVMGVVTDDEAKINDLFVRLNSSRALTGAEVRNARPGEVPALIRELVAHDFFTKKIRFNTLRSQDKNLAAKLLLIEHRGQLVDTKKTHLDNLVIAPQPLQASNQIQELQEFEEEEDESFEETEAESRIEETISATENPDIARSAQRVKTVLDKMATVFKDGDPLLSTQAPIIPYYWLIRGLNESQLNQVRPFIVDFEQKLKNRALTPDPELDAYYIMSRTSNDASSMRGRYRIMREHFDTYFLTSHSLS